MTYSDSVHGCDTINEVPQVEGIVAGNLKIFPNPSNGIFTIQLAAQQNKTTLIIMDVYGKVINSKTIESNGNLEINIKNNPPGTYFIRVLRDDIYCRGKVILW